MERHHLGQVARDPEDHEHVRDVLDRCPVPRGRSYSGAAPTAVRHSPSFDGVNRLRANAPSAGPGPTSPDLGENPELGTLATGLHRCPSDYSVCNGLQCNLCFTNTYRPRTEDRPGTKAES